MQIANLHHAKAHLSSLIQKAYSGEEVIICKAGKPLARLIKYEIDNLPRVPGLLQGQIIISDDFDELPEELLNAFNNPKL